MKILSYTRVFSDKTICLLRTLSNTNRANVSLVQQRTQQTLEQDVDNDEPIMLDNPYKKEKRLCILCKHDIEPDYKNVRLLSQFQSRFTGRIYGRHITGLCKRKQQRIEDEIKKAQRAGLMPSYHKEVTYSNDPKLFDIDNPFKPHKY